MPKKLARTHDNADAGACRTLAEGLLELYSAPDVADFQKRAVHLLRRLLPCAFVSFYEVESGSKVVRHVCDPARYAAAADKLRIGEQRALINGGARVTNLRRVEDSPSGADVSDVLVVSVQPTPLTRLTFSVARSDELFTDGDRAMCELLRPHLLRAYEVVVLLGQGRDAAAGEPDPAAASALLRRRFGLTDRESELLYWLARGKSNREMGVIFSISARTVDTHLQHVFDKMDVENRHAAVVKAMEALGTA